MNNPFQPGLVDGLLPDGNTAAGRGGELPSDENSHIIAPSHGRCRRVLSVLPSSSLPTPNSVLVVVRSS